MLVANIFDIERSSFVDGPGIRTTVFFKGCNLSCEWCHNPESQKEETEMLFYKNKCKNCGKCKEKCSYSLVKCDFCGKCVLYCPHDAREICGREYTVDEVFDIIKKDISFYESSGGGVTFSGGECMLYSDFLCEILKKCKEVGIHTAVDTAGHIPFSSFEKVMPYTDLFLYDIKLADESLHKKWTGVSNRLILENLRRLSDEFEGDIMIRIPVIGGVNDNIGEMTKISELLKEIKYISVELLPYHRLGENKYKALGLEHRGFIAPSDEDMKLFRKIF